MPYRIFDKIPINVPKVHDPFKVIDLVPDHIPTDEILDLMAQEYKNTQAYKTKDLQNEIYKAIKNAKENPGGPKPWISNPNYFIKGVAAPAALAYLALDYNKFKSDNYQKDWDVISGRSGGVSRETSANSNIVPDNRSKMYRSYQQAMQSDPARFAGKTLGDIYNFVKFW